MKEDTKSTLKTVGFWLAVGISYIGMSYATIKLIGKVAGKEVVKLLK